LLARSFAFSLIPLPSSINAGLRLCYLINILGTGRVYQVPIPGLLYVSLGACSYTVSPVRDNANPSKSRGWPVREYPLAGVKHLGGCSYDMYTDSFSFTIETITLAASMIFLTYHSYDFLPAFWCLLPCTTPYLWEASPRGLIRGALKTGSFLTQLCPLC
jgi:hypothetical protein